MVAKRLFDLFFSSLGLVVLSPLFLIVALWVKLDSPGPVFFRQIRVGRYEKPFRIYKFRTMVDDAEKRGSQITVGSDRRVTKAGAFLRKTKIDELPQLINVVKGEMSLVGPRPEVPKYVAHYPEEAKRIIFALRPGITDYAAIEYREESSLLQETENPEKKYVEEILPRKIELYERYARQRTLFIDFMLILKTILPETLYKRFFQ